MLFRAAGDSPTLDRAPDPKPGSNPDPSHTSPVLAPDPKLSGSFSSSSTQAPRGPAICITEAIIYRPYVPTV